ncbi:uncharacterized protein A4U43_C04F12350 [Asparagus officinalis]|uniref:Apple domain-containing protein n=1 Tax=Asparagus officinalis TaxID=4686 RepID=A0A5P1F0Y6_ASPOF|nr:uncharacterized protein A4U43_C04F12350 [Asparagus officinalis]
MNKGTGEYQTITSWKNTEDPAPGPFMETIDPSGLHQFIFLWNNSKIYWTSGIWNGETFSSLPRMSAYHLYIPKFVDDDKRRYFTINLTDERYLARSVIHSSGQVQQWLWFDDATGWELYWEQPVSPCDVYSVCGAFGCKRITHLRCSYENSTSGEKDGFLPIPNVHLPADSKQRLGGKGAEECELACLKNCSRTAYAYESGCSIWSGDIRNLQSLSEGDNRAGTLYLRLAASDLPKKTDEMKSIRRIAVSAATAIVLSAIIALTLIFFRRRHGPSKSPEGPLVSYSYSDLQRITKNFTEKLGGGGFGSVFKGLLSDSDFVAVKRLEGVRQGEKEF